MTVVAVAGGTGLVGRLVCARLRAAGVRVRVLARSTGVDLQTGAGLADGLSGVDAVVDVTNVQTVSGRRSTAFFGSVATVLERAGREAGVRHHVLLSIVGVDRVDLGYYRGKRRQEAVVRGGAVPWTVVRATQFHEFPVQLSSAPGPLVVVPRMRSRTVAADEVAALLVRTAAAEPAHDTVETAGPEVHEMVDLTRRWLRATGSRRVVVPLRVPGRTGAALAGGALLPGPAAVLGEQTYERWLAGQPGLAPTAD